MQNRSTFWAYYFLYNLYEKVAKQYKNKIKLKLV